MSDQALTKVGRIVGAHGIKGEVKVEPLTDFPERMEKGARLSIRDKWHEVEVYRIHKDRPILKLSEVSTRNAAEDLRGAFVEMVLTARPELEEDEYLTDDLIGMKVVNADGAEIGDVKDVLAYPAQDLLLVGETMIPLVKQFVKEIDLENGIIRVELIPGMLPGEEEL